MREVASYWNSTGLKLIHNFIDSMTRRIQQGIEMEGGRKKFCKSEILPKQKWFLTWYQCDTNGIATGYFLVSH